MPLGRGFRLESVAVRDTGWTSPPPLGTAARRMRDAPCRKGPRIVSRTLDTKRATIYASGVMGNEPQGGNRVSELQTPVDRSRLPDLRSTDLRINKERSIMKARLKMTV